MPGELKDSEPQKHPLALTVLVAALAALLLSCGLVSAVVAHSLLFPGAIVNTFRPSAEASCVNYPRTSGLSGSLCSCSIGASIIFTSQAPPVQVFAWYAGQIWGTRFGHLSILAGSKLDERNNPQTPPTYPLVVSLYLSLDGLP